MTSFDYFPMFTNPCHDILWSESAKGIHPENVPGEASKLQALLDRVASVKRATGSSLFDARGEKHANEVAARDAAASAVGDMSTDANTAGRLKISVS